MTTPALRDHGDARHGAHLAGAGAGGRAELAGRPDPGTASPGGTYHAYGAGLARMLTRVLGMPVAMRATEGPNQNIVLIEAGEAQLGFVTMGVALQAWNGTGDWTQGRQYRDHARDVPDVRHAVPLRGAAGRGVRSLADMAGKRIGVGPHGGTAGTYVPAFLAALKLEAPLAYGTWEELAAQMEGRAIDVLAAAAGVPFPAVAALEAKKLVRSCPADAGAGLELCAWRCPS